MQQKPIETHVSNGNTFRQMSEIFFDKKVLFINEFELERKN